MQRQLVPGNPRPWLTLLLIAALAIEPATTGIAGCRIAEDDGMHEQRLIVTGLAGEVEIERDRHGVPTIRADRHLDVIFGHGYVQAQDRFFQMDGMRRLAAGEVAAIAGPAVLEVDRQARKHRFRDVARRVVEMTKDSNREMLEHFTAGVNAAIDAMAERPFAYGILHVDPEPWRVEDTILALLGMFDMMHIEGDIERRVGVMHDALPEELVRFLTPRASRFDALLLPRALRDGELVNDWEPMPIPGPEVIDLRERAAIALPDDLIESTPIVGGSNNWAVAGSRTADGRAILANDPHLQYMVPGVWHRAVLEWEGGRAAGLALPGAPNIIIGSNEHVAWGLTNMMGDFQDLIIIDVDPDDPSRYRTPDGYESFGEVVEEIEVRGRGIERVTLKTTRWGVVTDEDWKGRPLVLKWTAFEPEKINVHFLDMMFAETLGEAIEVARSWHGPSQNIVMADAEGGIAWVVSGYLPKRHGFDGTRPVSWADGDVGWHGHIDETDRPMLVDPKGGILFTANNRTVPLGRAERLGGIWTAGTRARRIGEMLNNERTLDERDLFAMQHDTRVAIFDVHREALFKAARRHVPEDELSQRGLEILRQWNGRADADQPAMHVLDHYRRELDRRIIAPLVAPCRELDPTFAYRWFMSDEVVMRILEERPAHLLPPGEGDWDAFLVNVWRSVLEDIERRGEAAPDGIKTPWGTVNRMRMTHPLSAIMPFMADRLDMPDSPQSGHGHAVRVATPGFGASARMVVSPRCWDDAILQTPGGQSGDPNSENYHGDLHDDWLAGEPTSLVPEAPVHRIILVPED